MPKLSPLCAGDTPEASDDDEEFNFRLTNKKKETLLAKTQEEMPTNRKAKAPSRPYTYIENATVHGSPLLLCDGFEYMVNQKRKGILYLTCRRKKKKGINCPGRAILRLYEGDKCYHTAKHTCNQYSEEQAYIRGSTDVQKLQRQQDEKE